MKKYLLILFAITIVVLSGTVSAVTFTNTTTFNQGAIRYTMHEGLTLEKFDFEPNTIVINDEYDIQTIVQGGSLTLHFYDWSEDKIIGIESNVNQDITFKLRKNNTKHYLFDGKNYYLDRVNVSTSKNNYTVEMLTTVETIDTYDYETKNGWLKKNFLVFELPSLEKDGDDRLISVNNFVFIAIILSFILLVLVLRKIYFRGRR